MCATCIYMCMYYIITVPDTKSRKQKKTNKQKNPQQPKREIKLQFHKSYVVILRQAFT